MTVDPEAERIAILFQREAGGIAVSAAADYMAHIAASLPGAGETRTPPEEQAEAACLLALLDRVLTGMEARA